MLFVLYAWCLSPSSTIHSSPRRKCGIFQFQSLAMRFREGWWWLMKSTMFGEREWACRTWCGSSHLERYWGAMEFHHFCGSLRPPILILNVLTRAGPLIQMACGRFQFSSLVQQVFSHPLLVSFSKSRDLILTLWNNKLACARPVHPN